MVVEQNNKNNSSLSSSLFKVRVENREIVAPALPLQDHWLPLSNLDLLLPPVDVGVFFCYSSSSSSVSLSSQSQLDRSSGGPTSLTGPALKKALAQTLVSFYAFAGELVPNTEGEPELHCNNRGVEFVEAYADVALSGLDLYNPDESIEGKLVPPKKHGVLAVQVTELKCGSVVVSCTFDHRVADAYSANMFLVSWAAMAHPKHPNPPMNAPSFRRSLLNPRRPPTIPPSIDSVYVPVSSLPPPIVGEDSDDQSRLISRIYYVKATQLESLHNLTTITTNSNGTLAKPVTKLESFCAFLWKLVASCEARAGIICKMGVVVDGRARLGGGSMEAYFGNVLSIPFGGKKAGELTGKPLGWVAREIREFLSQAATEDHFLGLVDWVEAHRPIPGLARIYCQGSEDGPAFVVSSGQRFPVSDMDFGFGKPVFGSYHFPWGGNAGYVMPMPSPSGNGDWVVYMHLLERQIEVVEDQAGHFFKPFSFDCLNSFKKQ